MSTKCTCRNHTDLFAALQESQDAGDPKEWRQMILKAHGFFTVPLISEAVAA